MNHKLKNLLQVVWHEPRLFFLCLGILAFIGFAATAVMVACSASVAGPNILSVTGPGIGLAGFTIGCLLSFALSIPAFILAWIPPVRRWFGWLLERKLPVLGCLATLVALFYAVENWRGGLAWRNLKREEESKGERFDLAGLLPPPVPADQNFFETPLWTDMRFVVTNGSVVWDDTNWPNRILFDINGPNFSLFGRSSDWMTAGREDLAAWQAHYRGTNNIFPAKDGPPTNYFPITKEPQSPAADVLLALSRFDQDRQSLAKACARPQAWFQNGYDLTPKVIGPDLTRLSRQKSIGLYLRLHAVAALKAGEKETALEDLRMMFRVLDSTRNEPDPVHCLIRITLLQFLLQPLWEGMVGHAWNEGDLSYLQSELGKLDFLADYSATLRGERARELIACSYVRDAGIAPEDMTGLVQLDTAFAGVRRHSAHEKLRLYSARAILFSVAAMQRLAPSGWFEQGKVTICRRYDWLLTLVDEAKRTIAPARVDHPEIWLDPQQRRAFKLSLEDLQSRARCAYRCATGQAYADLARVACVLERYRLANGQYPEALEALAPKFIEKLPYDVINGQPLKYRQTKDGQFVLYSIGWNEIDDGGKPGLHPGGACDQEKGDWVWTYPSRQETK